MSEKIFLTRNQLAKFLPTPEAIKAFENLFKIATQQTPNNIDEVQISAESALSMANYSLSVLDNVSKLIEALELQPPEVSITNECECLEIIKEADWNFIKNHPTTINGYGITDAYSAINTTQKSDDVEYNLPFVSSVTAGNQSIYTDNAASITYNPSTNTLTTSNFKGKMTNNDTTMVSTNQTLTNWWGMYLATLGNSPIAGNPTKWIKIDDNGTIRYIPTWS